MSAAGLLLVSQARIQVFLPFSVPRPALIMAIVATALWLVQTGRARSLQAIVTDRIGRVAFIFVALAIVGVPFSLSMGSSARFLIDNFSRTFIAFIIMAAAVRDFEDVRRLIGTYAVGAAIFGWMTPLSRGSGGSIGGYDTNDAAMFLVSALPCLIFFVLHGRKLYIRTAAGASVLAVMAGIVATQSRGGFVGLVAVVLFMIFMFKGVKMAVRLGVVVALLGASVAFSSSEYWERMQTIAEFDDGYSGGSGVGGRRAIWGRALEYTLSNPLTGVGINQFSRAEGQHPVIQARIQSGIGTKFSVAHSTWFQAMAELGIPGFLVFLGMFVVCLRWLYRFQKHGLDPPPYMSRAELTAMAGVLIGSIVGIMAAGSFLTHAYTSMIWGPISIVVGFSKVSTMSGFGGRATRNAGTKSSIRRARLEARRTSGRSVGPYRG